MRHRCAVSGYVAAVGYAQRSRSSVASEASAPLDTSMGTTSAGSAGARSPMRCARAVVASDHSGEIVFLALGTAAIWAAVELGLGAAALLVALFVWFAERLRH